MVRDWSPKPIATGFDSLYPCMAHFKAKVRQGSSKKVEFTMEDKNCKSKESFVNELRREARKRKLVGAKAMVATVNKKGVDTLDFYDL